jgi:hypothetical protein
MTISVPLPASNPNALSVPSMTSNP